MCISGQSALRFALTGRRTDGAGGFFGIEWMSNRMTWIVVGGVGGVVVMGTVISAWPAPAVRRGTVGVDRHPAARTSGALNRPPGARSSASH